VWVEDPAALARGSGRFTIDVPNANSANHAVAVVRSLLGQIPGSDVAFKVVTVS
jgi:hypothetical protein